MSIFTHNVFMYYILATFRSLGHFRQLLYFMEEKAFQIKISCKVFYFSVIVHSLCQLATVGVIIYTNVYGTVISIKLTVCDFKMVFGIIEAFC